MDRISSEDSSPSQPSTTAAGSGSGQTGATTTAEGAALGTQPWERTVNYYPILESELNDLGRYATQSTVWFSVAGGFLSAGFTLYVESLISPEASPAGKALLHAGPWVCGVFVIASCIVAIIALRGRKSIIARIKEESQRKSATITTIGD